MREGISQAQQWHEAEDSSGGEMHFRCTMVLMSKTVGKNIVAMVFLSSDAACGALWALKYSLISLKSLLLIILQIDPYRC